MEVFSEKFSRVISFSFVGVCVSVCAPVQKPNVGFSLYIQSKSSLCSARNLNGIGGEFLLRNNLNDLLLLKRPFFYSGAHRGQEGFPLKKECNRRPF